MGLREDLIGLVGDETKVDEVLKAVGGVMIPKEEQRKVKDQLVKLQGEIEDEKKKNMNSEELLQHKIKEADDVKRDFGIKSNKLEAEKQFVNAGLTKEVYGELLDTVVSEDAEKTQTLVTKFIGVLGKEKESVANKTKESLLNNITKPNNPDNTTQKQSTTKTFI